MAQPLIASLAVLVLVAIAFAASYEALYGTHRLVAERMAALRLRALEAGEQAAAVERSALWSRARPIARWRLRVGQRYAGELGAAGWSGRRAPGWFALTRAVAGVTTFLLVAGAGCGRGWSAQGVAGGGLIGALIGGLLPVYWLKRAVARRRLRITHELANVLDMIVVCIEAGLALLEAIKLVGEEAARHRHAIGTELLVVTAELSAGVAAGPALRNAGERLGIEELKQLAGTITRSEQLGAQVAQALRASAEVMRHRRQLAAEAAAQKVTIRIFVPLVLFILPAMMIVLLAPALIEALRTFSF